MIEPPLWVHDAEVYTNYYLMGMKRMNGHDLLQFETWPGMPLNIPAITRAIQGQCLVTFNGINYDIPILALALAGADTATMKRASDAIILGGLKWWQVRDSFGGVDLSGLDHIDLMQVAPGRSGLKTYAARMHSRNLQELPIDPAAMIEVTDRAGMRTYNDHDLDKTIDLYTTLMPQLSLREEMTRKYGMDLRSKSDAQIAEAVIKSQMEALLGRRVFAPDIQPGASWYYQAPERVVFKTQGMRDIATKLQSEPFTLDSGYEIVVPPALDNLVVAVGKCTYTVGMGGLHSREKTQAHYATAERFLVDRDVRSYYPELILTLGIFPPHLGPQFLNVFRPIVEGRLEAKADPLRAGEAIMLKIVVNGTFGKFGNRYSIMFSPESLTTVTLTGQLYLLMLIETLELAGFDVVSANTDGVVVMGLRTREDEFQAIISAWEAQTHLVTEETPYTAIYAKDVNNYLAVKEGGKVKLKGLYSPAGLAKNPVNAICRQAVVDYLAQGVPIEKTINSATRLKDFLTARRVEEGAMYNGEALGQGVRWYYGYENTCIVGQTTGNRVARSEGAVPVMDLMPDAGIPVDLNIGWYVDESNSILRDIGATVSNA